MPVEGPGDGSIVTPSPAVAPEDASEFVPVVGTLASQSVKSAALVAGVVYAVAEIGYYAFYDALGLSPSEVGVDHTTVVVHALLGLAILGSIFAAVVLGIFIVGRSILGRLRPAEALERADDRAGPNAAERELLLAAFALPVWATYIGYQYWTVAGVSARASALTFFPDWVPYAMAVLTWVSWAVAWWRSQRTRYRAGPYRHAIVAAAAIGIAAALTMTQSLGEALGNHLIDHNELPSLFQTAFATVSVRADCVSVRPTGNSIGPLPPFAILLGQAGGTVVLYNALPAKDDPTVTWPIRVPAADVVLRGVPSDNCMSQ